MARRRRFSDRPSARRCRSCSRRQASPIASWPRRTELSAGYLNHIVHGNRPVPANEVIATLAQALGVEPEHFLEYRVRVITEKLEALPELVDRLVQEARLTVNLTAWLVAHNAVLDALFWEQPPSTPFGGGPYLLWDQSRKDDLHSAFDAAVAHQPTGLQDPPHNQLQLADDQGARTVLSPHDAWRIYATTVAQSLAVEIEKRVPWSIAGTPANELAILFDSRQFFSWNEEEQGYEVEFGVAGNATPCAPDVAYGLIHGLMHAKPEEAAPQA